MRRARTAMTTMRSKMRRCSVMKISLLAQFVRTTLWPYMLSVFLCFVVTLGLFPAVAAFVRPNNYDCNNVYHTKWFQPIWCFTLFNVGDTIGRISASKVPFPKPQQSFKLL